MKRVLYFVTPCHLKLHLQQIVVAMEDGSERTVPIEDVGLVLIEHQRVSITVPLLNA